MENFSDLIHSWPSLDEFAIDTGAKLATVRKWEQRQSIPSEYFRRIVAAAQKRKLPVTAQTMIELAERP